MPYPVPKKASRLDGRRMLTNLLIFAVMLAVFVLLLDALSPSGFREFFLSLLVSITLLFLLFFVQSKWLGKLLLERYQRIDRQLLSQGYECILQPSQGLKELFHSRFRPLEEWIGLPRGEKGIQWLGTVPHEAGEVLLMEYLFQTGYGRYREEHFFSIAAWPHIRTDLPGARLGELDGCAFYRLGFLRRRMWKKVRLRGEPFDNIWRHWVATGSAETARAFLTPAVKSELAHSPKGERWYIGGGMAICLYTEPMDADQWPVFLHRAEGILSLAGGTGS